MKVLKPLFYLVAIATMLWTNVRSTCLEISNRERIEGIEDIQDKEILDSDTTRMLVMNAAGVQDQNVKELLFLMDKMDSKALSKALLELSAAKEKIAKAQAEQDAKLKATTPTGPAPPANE